MDPADDPSSLGTCTSCTILEDFSNYWTASMYFRSRNGTFKRVPQVGFLGSEAANGGMTIYYFSPSDPATPVTAFAPGFRMRSGDPNASDAAAAARFGNGITYTCLDRVDRRNRYDPVFPPGRCPFGILTTLWFPACWDGVNLDSHDHFSHVSYQRALPWTETREPCPASHPVQLQMLVLETMWDTTAFNDPALWPEDGSQPFLWSFGDRTGYGSHGDFLFGWMGNSLQNSFDPGCTGFAGCGLRSQRIPQANTCTKGQTVVEDVDGWMDELPGGIVVD